MPLRNFGTSAIAWRTMKSSLTTQAPRSPFTRKFSMPSAGLAATKSRGPEDTAKLMLCGKKSCSRNKTVRGQASNYGSTKVVTQQRKDSPVQLVLARKLQVNFHEELQQKFQRGEGKGRELTHYGMHRNHWCNRNPAF